VGKSYKVNCPEAALSSVVYLQVFEKMLISWRRLANGRELQGLMMILEVRGRTRKTLA
jgi:hypothetical protein